MSAAARREPDRSDRDNTLDASEQQRLGDVAAAEFPWHSGRIQSSNGQSWFLLEPCGPELKRFTICRVDGCVMVMVEDPRGDRHLFGAATLEIAIDVLRGETRRQTAVAIGPPPWWVVH